MVPMNLPGLELDFDLRQELKFDRGILDLRQFDKIILSISGGKDSHAMLFMVRELAEKQGVLERLIAVYADTGMEWHNAESHVLTLCRAARVPVEIVYPVRPMLEKIAFRIERCREYVTKAGFPTPQCRYCTSEQKVHPMDKFVRQFSGILLKITGERWSESKSRAKLPEFCLVPRISNSKRIVYGWRPMLAFSEADIWSMVKQTGVPRHECYEHGCSRLGCAGCIFSADYELKIEMRENPHIFEALDRLEIDSGFTMNIDGKRVRDRIK